MIQFGVGTAQHKKPNIVFILADDLGWGELNSYQNTFNETPNLNKLAAQGMRFTQAYAAAPNCSPTRASLMTGQYPARVGITDFLPEGEKTNKRLDPKRFFTINEALSKAGYHTGIIGKWHLDTDFEKNTCGPKAHGFDEVIGTESKYIGDGDYFFPYDKIEGYQTGAKDEYLTDRQCADAADFINRNKTTPFFLYLSFYSVHTSLDAPERLVHKYKQKFDGKYGAGMAEKLYGKKNIRHGGPHKDNPYLAAMLESMDAGIGHIMETLKKNGLDRNTLVVFFSDNGGAGKMANNGLFRDSKMSLYEGGIREPLIMRWPGKIPEGKVEDTPVCSIDFYPTFLKIAGAVKEKDYLLDGLDLDPLFSGKVIKRNELYWHYPSETARNPVKMASAVRKGDFKLMSFYADPRMELYDLKNDPGESTDVSAGNVAKVAELKLLLDQWKKEVNAEAPVLKMK